MEQFYADFIERLHALHSELHQQLADFPPEALDWSPGPEMNSVTVIITHLTGAERFWLGDVAAGEPSGRTRSTEFEVKNLSAADLSARLAASLDYARNVLSHFTLDDLARECTEPHHGKTFTVGWCLLHVLEHTAEHTGHIQLMRQLWAQRA